MPKGWRQLESLPRGAKLLDDYGDVASRWKAALDAGAELPPTWLLDRKRHRRVLDAVLPPGHRLLDVAADRAPIRRAAKAARAFERVRTSTEELPLPEWPENTRAVVLWCSPVVRPKGIQLISLEGSLEVEPTESAVRAGICRLWASVYLEQTLREIASRGAKRVEVVVGLTALGPKGSDRQAEYVLTASEPHQEMGAEEKSADVPPAVESWTALLTEQERTPQAFPLPGLTQDCAPESALSVSIGAHTASAWRSLLKARWGRAGAELVHEGAGRWQWSAEPMAGLLRHMSPVERAAVQALLGAEPARGEEDGSLTRRQLAMAPQWSRELIRQNRLLDEVNAHEGHCRDMLSGLIELDLAVLPDDGLKRTIEDAMQLIGQTAELVAETTWSAEALIACCERLVPQCGLLVDAGVDALPWIGLAAQWEERLAVVRNDEGCRRALLESPGPIGWSMLPEGPGRRALLGLVESHGYLARRPQDPACPRFGENLDELAELARVGVQTPVDVYGRCREARFAADRALAFHETDRGRWFALSFGAMRGLARDAVLLRERCRALELHGLALMRRIALDVDRRLRRLELGLPVGAAFDCTIDELLAAVDLRGTSLAARVSWRRAENERTSRRPEPWYPPLRAPWLKDGAPVVPERAPVVPLSLGTNGAVQGGGAGSQLRAEFLDGLWLTQLPYVSGVQVRWGRRHDSTAVLARALGVPLSSTLGHERAREDAKLGQRGLDERRRDSHENLQESNWQREQ